MLPCLFISALGNLNGTQTTSLRHHLSEQPPCLVLTIDRSRQPAQSSFSSWTRSRRASFENRMHPSPSPPPPTPLPFFFLQPSHEGAGPDAFLTTRSLAIAASLSPISNQLTFACSGGMHFACDKAGGGLSCRLLRGQPFSSTALATAPKNGKRRKSKASPRTHTHTRTHARTHTTMYVAIRRLTCRPECIIRHAT